MIKPICGACPPPARTRLPGQGSFPDESAVHESHGELLGPSFFSWKCARKKPSLRASNQRKSIESDIQ